MINGKIDSVFDRGGFVAVDGVEQEMYINAIRKLLADDFRYLLSVVEYDKTKRYTMPFPQPEEKVRKFFDWGTVEKLDAWAIENRFHNPNNVALEIKEVVYLITPRKN